MDSRNKKLWMGVILLLLMLLMTTAVHGGYVGQFRGGAMALVKNRNRGKKAKKTKSPKRVKATKQSEKDSQKQKKSSSKKSKKDKKNGSPQNAVLVSVDALVSGTASTAPIEQMVAIAELMGGTLAPGDSFFLPTGSSARPFVGATFSVRILGDDVVDVEGSLAAASEGLRLANVIRVRGVEVVQSERRSLQDSPLFVIELTECPSICGSAIITEEDEEAALEAGIPIEELLPALLFSGYCYPQTNACVCTGGFGGSSCDVICGDLMASDACDSSSGCAWCETTGLCLTSASPVESVARTEEEIGVCPSCSDLSGDEFGCSASQVCDYCATSQVCFDATDPTTLCDFAVVSSSPVRNELDVAVTRETVLYLSEPVNRATVDDTSVIVESQGQELDSTVVHVSSDGTTVTIFYMENLPANSNVDVRLTNAVRSATDNQIEPFELTFTTLGLIPVPDTYVCGRVFASGFKTLSDGSSLAETPLAGATITVDGAEGTINAVTDIGGAFVLGPTPSGTFFVHIDGRTSSQGEDIGGEGAYFPFVGKSWTAVAGKMNNQDTIYLPLISPGTLTAVSEDSTTVVEFPQEVVDENPFFAGVSLQVPPGALIDPAGIAGTDDRMVGIAPVPSDRLPGQLPETLSFPVVITIQTVGGSNFDSPVPVCFPNLPETATGEILAPGGSTSLWSFNHDTGRFEIVGPATVNSDGSLVCSDPGYGILAPGWHGVSPGTGAEGPDDQEDCEAGNECCQGGPNAGNPSSPEKGTFGQVIDAWKVGNVAKGCLETVYTEVFKKTLSKGLKCGSSVYNLASGLVLDNAGGAPTGALDVVNRVSSYNANKWAVIRECAGAGLSTFLPVSNGFKLGLALYKCARSAQKALDDNLCDPTNPGCGNGPPPTSFCGANDLVNGALDGVDTFINLLEGFNLLRRRLVEFPEAVTDEQTEDIFVEEFFADRAQYDRVRTAELIIERLEALEAAALAGDVSDAELLTMYDEYVADLEVLRDALQVTVVDLSQPMLDLADLSLDFMSSMNKFSVERAQFVSGSKSRRELYIYMKTEDDDEFRIKTTPTGGIVGLTLPASKDFFYYAYNVQENLFGFAEGTTSRNGIPTVLPDISLMVASDELLVDTDGDGICDLCEFTIGTNPDLADSDSDGAGDLQELLAGTNPLDGLALSTGVVAIVPLVAGRGSPTYLELSGSFVFMIMGGGGIAIYNVFNALQPALIALVGPALDFVELSADSDRLLARTTAGELMLFSGTDFSTMVDVTALYPRLLNVAVSSIHMSPQFAFVGTNLGGLLIFESDFGSHVQSLDTVLSQAVAEIALTPIGIIACVLESSVVFFEPNEQGVALWKEIPTVGSIQNSQSHTLQVGTSEVYTMSFEGELDVASASGESLGSSSALPTPTFDFVVTEEGGGDINALVNNGVEVWNIDDPNAPSFVARFGASGLLRAPVLAAGSGFLYLGTSNGLAVLNTKPADVFGNAPNIVKLGVVYRGVEIASGLVEERSVLNIYAQVEDDVGIRNVVFAANNAQLKIDSSFPFSATVTVPPFASSTTLNISAIAWDTAGNMAEEVSLSFEVAQDVVAPSVLSTFPRDNSSIAFEESETEVLFVISYTEPLIGTIEADQFSIQELSGDMTTVDPSLLQFFANPGLGEVEVSVPVSELELGQHRVDVGAGFVSDVNGNPSGSVGWEFNVTVASNVRTAVAVIDESDDSQSYVDDRWDDFRATYPDRPFCLLRPVGTFGFLKIPAGFDGIYSNVTRDEGNPSLASDWFTICKLNEIDPLIRKIGLFVDNSGSMRLSTVEASLNLFFQKVNAANFETLQVTNRREHWIDVFLVDLQ